jgi:hypothetical protein
LSRDFQKSKDAEIKSDLRVFLCIVVGIALLITSILSGLVSISLHLILALGLDGIVLALHQNIIVIVEIMVGGSNDIVNFALGNFGVLLAWSLGLSDLRWSNIGTRTNRLLLLGASSLGGPGGSGGRSGSNAISPAEALLDLTEAGGGTATIGKTRLLGDGIPINL